ncbi:MAG: CPBP family intramembrane metalloprotease [Rhodopirellula sp.]|nr:CPBP family intramembrane metalloprotease [Rhodopirellula sp.]
MPDSTTPDNHPKDRAAESAVKSVPTDDTKRLAASSSPSDTETADPSLDADSQAEVAAFRQNLDATGSGEISELTVDDADETAANTATRLRAQLLAQRRQLKRLPPGPGIPEAIGWMLAVIGIHLLAGLFALVVIVTGQAMRSAPSGAGPSPEILAKVVASLPRLVETYLLELMAIEMLVFLVAAVVATRLRLGPKTSHLLGIRPLTVYQFLLIVAVWIPISQMSGGLHLLTSAAWDQWFAHLPGMGFFENTNVNNSLKPLGESAPIGFLFLVMAVAPAIGEEIIFRGIIGRGLVARYGIVAGVIMTSLLFAAVHIHPAHAVALLPLAVFMHVIYLATRSLLAPILLHLLNNSLAVVLLKLTATAPTFEGVTEPEVPAYVMLISAGIVLLAGWTLWRSRVEYRTEDGSPWSPGYPTVEIPPESAGATLTMAHCPLWLRRNALGLAGAYSLVFVVTLVLMLTGHIST